MSLYSGEAFITKEGPYCLSSSRVASVQWAYATEYSPHADVLDVNHSPGMEWMNGMELGHTRNGMETLPSPYMYLYVRSLPEARRLIMGTKCSSVLS